MYLIIKRKEERQTLLRYMCVGKKVIAKLFWKKVLASFVFRCHLV